MSSVYEIREYREEDKNFIMSTFLRGLYYGDSWFSVIPKDVFMANYKLLLERIMANPRNTIQVACFKEDPDVIMGYSILSSDYQSIHYVFVKTAFRRKGIAKALLPSHPQAVTHLTELGKILLPKLNGAIFNPFL